MLLLIITLLFFISCSDPTSNQGSQLENKDGRLIGTWFWKGHSDFSKIIFTDSSYYQIIDSTEFIGDWETRNDSLIVDYGATEITTYKVISQDEWWNSHPYFIWIPYVRDSMLTDTNIIDTSDFNTDNIDVFIGNYTLLNSLSFVINPGSDTTFLNDFQGNMIIDSLKMMTQIFTESGTTDTTSLRIVNIESDTLVTCYNGKSYINYSTEIKNDTLSLYYLFNTGVTSIVEVWPISHNLTGQSHGI